MNSVFCIGQRLFVGGLRNAERLGRDAHSRSVHQVDGVFDQTELPAAYQLSGCIIKLQLACRRPMNAQLVLNTADHYTVRSITGKHAQAASVLRSGFRTRQHYEHFTVSIRDETLDAAEEPLPFCVLIRLQLYCLQIGTRIRFR